MQPTWPNIFFFTFFTINRTVHSRSTARIRRSCLRLLRAHPSDSPACVVWQIPSPRTESGERNTWTTRPVTVFQCFGGRKIGNEDVFSLPTESELVARGRKFRGREAFRRHPVAVWSASTGESVHPGRISAVLKNRSEEESSRVFAADGSISRLIDTQKQPGV